MKVGIPSEVKNNEYRVAITPAGVHELRLHDMRSSSNEARAEGRQ
jgi:alanine dehydrogenase